MSAVKGDCEVVGRGGVHHLLRITAADPCVLVIIGQHRRIARAKPQAGRLFPPGAEPDRLGQLDEAESIGEETTNHGSRVAKRRIKIRNDGRIVGSHHRCRFLISLVA